MVHSLVPRTEHEGRYRQRWSCDALIEQIVPAVALQTQGRLAEDLLKVVDRQGRGLVVVELEPSETISKVIDGVVGKHG